LPINTDEYEIKIIRAKKEKIKFRRENDGCNRVGVSEWERLVLENMVGLDLKSDSLCSLGVRRGGR
jgi:hypothetical protein